MIKTTKERADFLDYKCNVIKKHSQRAIFYRIFSKYNFNKEEQFGDLIFLFSFGLGCIYKNVQRAFVSEAL